MPMDLLDVIRKEHGEAKNILEEMEKTTSRAGRKREKLLDNLSRELTVHMRAEERTLYMALGEDKEERPKVLEAMEEHHVTERALSELKRLGTDDERWLPKVKVLKELIEHHVEEEEEGIFEAARSNLEPEVLQSLLKKFLDEKQRLQKRFE